MPQEPVRGCGYRTVGSTYLVGSGITHICDNLPLELVPCNCCGYVIPFTRSWVWVNKRFILDHDLMHHIDDLGRDMIVPRGEFLGEGDCKCPPECAICHPITAITQDKLMVMWVGEKSYTPNSFILEAQKLGVSRKISSIPKKLKLNETWIMLAYKKYPFRVDFPEFKFGDRCLQSEPVKRPAIFYAFRPQRFEKLIWKSDATPDHIRELEEQGITPIIIEDGDKDHAPSRGR